ncbi:hypothetical protein GCM10008932_13420 [Alkalibacterium iburiense]|uniref:Flagellar hook-length control protein-like C-terminal domain-containing protein n=1 Tax=Alkalibacterium iburiense TaxID=290589 RepID=A0ABN0XEE8_9LACT
MENIQTIPIYRTEPVQKETVHVNEEEFALQFQKFSFMKDEESSKESGLQPSSDSASTESVENKEDVESEDRVFTLINPFLHIQTETMKVKTEVISHSDLVINGDVLSEDSTYEKLLADFGQSNRSDDSVSLQLLQISETVGMSEGSPDLEVQFLNKALVEPTEQALFKDNKFIQPSDITDIKEPTSLLKDEEQVVLAVNRSDHSKEPTQSVEAIDQTMRSVTVEETDTTLKSIVSEINSENESKLSSDKVINSDEDETLSHTFSMNEVKQTNEEITKPVQSTPSLTIPVVTKEEGMEMIKEMVTETLVDDNGVETVRSTIKLTPESLGEVEIELVSTDKGLTGKIVFQSEEAKQWMEREWEQFKLPLETKGVSFQTLELTVSQPIQNHTLQSQLGKFSFSESFSQSQQDQAANQQTNHGEGIIGNDETENSLEQGEAQQLNGLNVYV